LKGLKDLKGSLPEEVLYEVAAKRFEYTYESLWKTARLFLLEEKGIECNSPMDCFKSLYSVGLIDESFSEDIPRIVRMRNSVVYIYDFSLAKDVYSFVDEVVIPAFENVISNLREACGR